MKRMYAFLFGLLCSLTLIAQNNFPPLHTVQAYHRFNSLLQLPINNGEQARFYTDRAVDFVRSGPLHMRNMFMLSVKDSIRIIKSLESLSVLIIMS